MKKYNKLWLLFGISYFVSCNPDPDSVTKPVLLPKVKTTEVEYVTQYTATLGGIVTSVGESDMIEYGVCLSKNPHPTESGDIKKNDIIETIKITTPFEFTFYVQGLTGNTVYYVRAFAQNMNKIIYNNGVGFIKAGETVYGNEYKFTTDIETPTVTDADGNVYRTIQIGTQLWMAENLKTTKYNDGTDIPTVKGPTWYSFFELSTPGYCDYYYQKNYYNLTNTYGVLYNGYAVTTGKLAPIGWHIPSIDDWEKLSDYLGGDSVSGAKLKSANTFEFANNLDFMYLGNWMTPNTGATNTSGFSALPGGYNNGVDFGFQGIGYFGHWWSSTEAMQNSALYSISLSYTKASTYFTEGISTQHSKHYGFSVRCIRD